MNNLIEKFKNIRARMFINKVQKRVKTLTQTENIKRVDKIVLRIENKFYEFSLYSFDTWLEYHLNRYEGLRDTHRLNFEVPNWVWDKIQKGVKEIQLNGDECLYIIERPFIIGGLEKVREDVKTFLEENDLLEQPYFNYL